MSDKKDIENTARQLEKEALLKELEELKETFQAELDKATEQADKLTVNEVSAEEESEPVSEDLLCECCGEKVRGTKAHPDSHYCKDCDRALRRYPFDFLNILIAVIVIAFCGYATFVFASNANIYVSAEKADSLVKTNMLYSANTQYSEVIEDMENKGINGELVYKRALVNLAQIGGYDSMNGYSDVFKTWELKLPHLKSVSNAFEDKSEFERTRDTCYEIIYSNIPDGASEPSQVPYDLIIGQLDELIGKTIEPITYTQEEIDDGVETTTAAYSIEGKKYSDAMISYFKFYTAAICEKDYQTQISFLEEIRSAYPEMTWLYGAMLGDLYIKTGADVLPYAEYLKSVNAEDSYADVAMATWYRVQGSYEASLKLCREKVEENDDYSFEFYRQSALTCLAIGDYESAVAAAESAYEEYSSSIQVLDTMALCYAAAGNEEGYKNIEEIFAQSSMTVDEEVMRFKNGEISLDTILKEGDFDVA